MKRIKDPHPSSKVDLQYYLNMRRYLSVRMDGAHCTHRFPANWNLHHDEIYFILNVTFVTVVY